MMKHSIFYYLLIKLRRFKQILFLNLKTSIGLKLIVFFLFAIFLSSAIVYVIEKNTNEGFVSLFDSLWWTVVTISTVGYGDRIPHTLTGRLFAIGIIFFGMAVMGTVTGRIASFIMERQMKEEKGLMDYSKLKGHFIICGWKREMNMVLENIIDANPVLSTQEILLLNRAGQEAMNDLRSKHRFKGIKYVNGDYVEERDLKRAGIDNAARVLILADYLAGNDLQQIDSKTVMAVMSIKNVNKNIYICAELLDTKFEKYLRLSHCDEIFLSRDFVRSMIASSASGSGLAHILSSLLPGDGNVNVSTRQIPKSFIGKNYQELSQYFKKQQYILPIGILENTGSITKRREEALREAQKMPDISKIVPELKNVKTLLSNEPIINPPKDYEIKKYSKAIVISGTSYKTLQEQI